MFVWHHFVDPKICYSEQDWLLTCDFLFSYLDFLYRFSGASLFVSIALYLSHISFLFFTVLFPKPERFFWASLSISSNVIMHELTFQEGHTFLVEQGNKVYKKICCFGIQKKETGKTEKEKVRDPLGQN